MTWYGLNMAIYGFHMAIYGCHIATCLLIWQYMAYCGFDLTIWHDVTTYGLIRPDIALI